MRRETLRGALRALSDDELVFELTRQPATIQRKICFELGRRRPKTAASAMVPLLASSDAHTRAAAAEALGDIGESRYGDSLLSLLRDPNQPEFVRDTVAYALGVLRYEPALRELLESVYDPSATVRLCAVAALSPMATSDIYPQIVLASLVEQDARVKAALQSVLRSIGPASKSLLQRAARSGKAVVANAPRAVYRIQAFTLGRSGIVVGRAQSGSAVPPPIASWALSRLTLPTSSIEADVGNSDLP